MRMGWHHKPSFCVCAIHPCMQHTSTWLIKGQKKGGGWAKKISSLQFRFVPNQLFKQGNTRADPSEEARLHAFRTHFCQPRDFRLELAGTFSFHFGNIFCFSGATPFQSVDIALACVTRLHDITFHISMQTFARVGIWCRSGGNETTWLGNLLVLLHLVAHGLVCFLQLRVWNAFRTSCLVEVPECRPPAWSWRPNAHCVLAQIDVGKAIVIMET